MRAPSEQVTFATIGNDIRRFLVSSPNGLIMKTLNKFNGSLAKFHKDERGLEALQIVMIIAVAAVALIFVKKNWDDGIKPWFDDVVGQVLDFTE